jgi:glutathione S-transferase
MEDDIKILEKKLSDHGKLWACGDEFTMADVFWTASLFRMQWIGIGYLFSQEKNPYVHAYAERLLARQSFQTAMCNWALPPSSYIPRMDTIAYKAWFFWNFGLELLGF